MAMKTNGRFDVGGVLLAQPFKIRRLGHFGLNVPDPAACLDFYCEGLGFRISDPLDVAEHHPKRERRDDLVGLLPAIAAEAFVGVALERSAACEEDKAGDEREAQGS